MPKVKMDRKWIESTSNRGKIRIRLDVEKEKAVLIWDRIKDKYQTQAEISAPLNTYVRDLILRDSGVDIALSIWSKHDPLCDPTGSVEIIEGNPGWFTEKQKFWLGLRAQGKSCKEISELSAARSGEGGEWARGHTQPNISMFFQRVRRDLGFEEQGN